MTGEERRRIEEAYLVLSDPRYLLHREDTLTEYQRTGVEHHHRIAASARGLGELLPPSRLDALDDV